MWTRGIRGVAALGVLLVLACVFAASRASRADDDTSASLIGSWRGTRRAPGTTAVRHNLLSFLRGGEVIEAGPSVYVTGANFANASYVETAFVGTWVSEGHGNFVAHLMANLSDPLAHVTTQPFNVTSCARCRSQGATGTLATCRYSNDHEYLYAGRS